MLPTWLSFPLLFPYRVNVGSLGSLIPYSVNGPFKRTLMALFRLAWSNKLQLPIFITVCFMAFDIRLQLEINIFWEANHQNGRNRVPGNGNPPIIVPVLEIHANEGDVNSSDDSDDEEEDTDSDETELHSLKDNNDSDDMEEDDDETDRTNPRFFSDHQDHEQNNSSDYNLNDEGSNNDNTSTEGNSRATNSSSNAAISRTNIIIPSDSITSHQFLTEELNSFLRNYCTSGHINILKTWSKKTEQNKLEAMSRHSDFNNTNESRIRNMRSLCPSPSSALSSWRCKPKNNYGCSRVTT